MKIHHSAESFPTHFETASAEVEMTECEGIELSQEFGVTN